MSYYRNILSELENWKKRKDKKPIVIRGARQVGKTTLVDDFSKSFKHYVSLNLERSKHLKYFQDFDDVKPILEAICFDYKIPVKDLPNTLLFIDEIQESERAIKLLRYFYEDYPDLCVISAGSLLEFVLKRVQNLPVGRVEFLYLYPFNFEEYLLALDNKQAIEQLNNIPINKFAHQSLLQYFHRYVIVGGMPEIIKKEVEKNSLIELVRVYESIFESYKNDIEKYTETETTRRVINHLFNTVHFEVDKRIKFQNFGNSNYRSREVSEQMRNLEDAKIIKLIYPTTNIIPPITPDKKKSPKLQYLDTGLLNYNLKIQSELLKSNNIHSAYQGAIIPHIINQQIISLDNITNSSLNFWVREKKQSSAEVDLIIHYDDKLIPIEIKSGSYGKLRSLHQFVDLSKHHYAIRFYAGEFCVEKAKTPNGTNFYLMNLPYYLSHKIYSYLEYFLNKY
jgi:predicted AAA+ superfamily ATPase